MNHEPFGSISAIPSSSHHTLSHHAPAADSSQDASAATTASNGTPQTHDKGVQTIYKTQFLSHLIRQLDIVIYCELSILYYMDCSLFSFLARSLNHWFYFTPKPPLSPILTGNRPHMVVIFALNILSIFFHAISAPPTAGEAVRGYLHGGLLIDFVGQKSPVPRVKMVAFDLLVLVLQLVMLGVTVEKRRLDAPDGETGGRGEGGAEEGQDHDAEERGWRRSQEDREGIELQSLGVTSGGRSGGEEDGERNESSNGIEGAANAHPGDAFYSGQYVVASVRIIDNIRAQWREGQPAATGSAESSSMRTAAAAELARRRLRFRIRIGGRDYGL